jgi:O-succinylbenzoate synthase
MRKIEVEPLREILDLPEFEIVGYKVGVVNLRLNSPMKLPFGVVESRPSGVLRVDMKVGGRLVCGYGEGATLQQPIFTDDCGENIVPNANKILSTLNGEYDLTRLVSEVQSVEFGSNKLYPTVRMMIEMAILDGLAKGVETSVANLLGIDTSKGVDYGKSLGGGNFEDTIVQIINAVNKGAIKIKLKISPESHEIVLESIKWIKREMSEVCLMVDANGTYDVESETDMMKLKEIDGLGLLMIEEPVSRVGSIRGLDAVEIMRRKLGVLKTKICLDDCLTSVPLTVAAIEHNLADVVNIKPGRVGSIIRALEIGHMCRNKGKEVMVGGMLEATPGRCMTNVVAAYFEQVLGFGIPGDLSLAQERIADDLIPVGHQLKYNLDGTIQLSSGQGWGFEDITLLQ